MATTITLEEAQATLKELIHNLAPGDEVIITEGTQPIAKIVGEAKLEQQPRPEPGLGKNSIMYMAPDFDATPDDLKEYI
jgi:antitoxin (DNA-binding transcriptional repressor) of toxin-antitoxin stability system